MTTEPNPPITENTKAILAAIAKLEGRLDQLQDVSEAIQMIKQMRAEHETWRDATKRALNTFMSIAFPRREEHK